ncbi:MAG: methyltransferase domain-containing protein [Planctomycetes bacterium]|nr:methyltransferase domain-containing protein [Planctomycetota bacterium]
MNTEPLDLYDSHYDRTETDVYRAVRAETFGEDLGQTSWITAEECDEHCRWLALGPRQRVLEIACGSGGIAARMAQRCGVSVVGIDIHASAVEAATARAGALAMHERLTFQAVDADARLPFPDGSFDAVYCNDAINHLRDRRAVLSEWARVLRPGGRCLYTDPVVVTGSISNAELASRSSIGFFLFTPLGVDAGHLHAAGFRLVLTADGTENVARTSQRWFAARARQRGPLCQLEGSTRFEDLQRFLATVHTLASERRLSRFAYVGEKQGPEQAAFPQAPAKC